RISGFRRKRTLLFGESGRIVSRFKATPSGLAAYSRLLGFDRNDLSLQDLLLNGLDLNGECEFALNGDRYVFPSWCRYLGRAISADELRQCLDHLLAQE